MPAHVIIGGVNDWRQVVIEGLSVARMYPYMERCSGNRKAALNLYRWHGELTAAVQTVLGNTEVVLRNAIDQELQAWNQAQIPGTDSWLLQEPAAPLRSLSAAKRKDALRRAKAQAASRPVEHHRYCQEVTHDDVLAQIMFGMWRDLLPNHLPGANPELRANINRARIWNEALCCAFPHVDDVNGEITFWRVAHLHRLRNRVSHVEPLLNVDVNTQIQEAFDLVASINPVVADWLTGISQVSAVIARRPAMK
ncbi:hypothetical protein [Actinomyces sp. S4-C9]|uniref:hypothetical protein n=1 Tax=Actinomyces sp. S4-C9 TaxID=1219581 RepID=UPI00050FB58D|nr:hypothetical protein [Actinomyces sp. S4-C9]KGF01836.1 hypothetical protein HMPREF1628_04170 [Actinomyces sp. S4-C9]